MPTADEFAATIDHEYRRIPETGGWVEIDANSTAVNAVGTTKILSGYTKVSSNQPYFPASGVRHSVSELGQLNNISFMGYYWSSSRYNASQAYSMNLREAGVFMDQSNNRLCGMSVRCVVE
ncbi:hypothetical protein FACS18947_2000 [Bacteroidia bacterium]|nr:hypothetical protein FACS18947_2000 [Bacteroidia bacterium]